MSLQIGITGGIGSGKSLISKIFYNLGVPIYDADSRAKYLMSTDVMLMKQIRKEFGDASITGNIINRAYISNVVFQNPERLAVLNGLVHPSVNDDYKKWLMINIQSKYVMKEAALLIESKSYQDLDHIIVVSAPQSLRIKRVLKRDPQRTVQQIEAIIHNQIPEEKKLKLASFIITNDETTLVIPQVLELHNQFCNT